MEIAGQAALISGGGSGLGRATAQALAKAGARVAVLDINEAAAVAAAKEIGGFAAACDVTNAADTEAAVAAARERHGPARLVVACAGIGAAGRIVGRDGPLPLDAFRRTIEVNLIGSFNLLRLAAADMTNLDPLDDGERGLIVLTASVAAYDKGFGYEKDLGTVEVGKLADLILVAGEPLKDVRDVAKVRQVIVDGRLYTIPDLLGPFQPK